MAILGLLPGYFCIVSKGAKISSSACTKTKVAGAIDSPTEISPGKNP